MKTLTVGALFAGIGGLELGLEMAGPFHTLWQAERDPYARLILEKHWPSAQRFDDVRAITAAAVPHVDVLTGGFPCQPHSLAGKRESSNDERDLWSEYARIIGEIRPRWVVAENVPGLLSSADPAHGRGRGGFFGRVLRDLAERGYDAEWRSLTASGVGAHHKRQRVFLVAYAQQCQSVERHEPAMQWGRAAEAQQTRLGGCDVAHADGGRFQQGQPHIRQGQQYADGRSADVDNTERFGWRQGWADYSGHVWDFAGTTGQDAETLAHGASFGQSPSAQQQQRQYGQTNGRGQSDTGGVRAGAPILAHAVRSGQQEQHAPAEPGSAGHGAGRGDAPDWAGGSWQQPHPLTGRTESGVRVLADGLPSRVDELRTLGNAVVPQCAAVIGRAIQAAEAHLARYGVMPEQIVRPEHLLGAL